ncbi:MAG: hypothetical protein LUE91_00320 [Oscillospiraceae bacterium]|nr:hypothetical protein [Oscillospiraceae bacterium]
MDTHEKMVVAERDATFRYYHFLGSDDNNDIEPIKAPGKVTGVGSRDTGMPQQRNIGERMVPQSRDNNNLDLWAVSYLVDHVPF